MSDYYWLKLFSNRSITEAEYLLCKERRYEKKLKKMGGSGNWSDIEIRLEFEGPGKKSYAVWVLPYSPDIHDKLDAIDERNFEIDSMIKD